MAAALSSVVRSCLDLRPFAVPAISQVSRLKVTGSRCLLGRGDGQHRWHAGMLLGEADPWDAPDASVRPDLVVVAAPSGDLGLDLVQRLEPVFVQTLVAEAPFEGVPRHRATGPRVPNVGRMHDEAMKTLSHLVVTARLGKCWRALSLHLGRVQARRGFARTSMALPTRTAARRQKRVPKGTLESNQVGVWITCTNLAGTLPASLQAACTGRS